MTTDPVKQDKRYDLSSASGAIVTYRLLVAAAALAQYGERQ